MDSHPFGGNSKDDASGSSECGMPGTGTNYARRIGIVKHIRGGIVTTVSHGVRDTKRGNQSWNNLKREVDCQVGDEIEGFINACPYVGGVVIEKYVPSVRPSMSVAMSVPKPTEPRFTFSEVAPVIDAGVSWCG